MSSRHQTGGTHYQLAIQPVDYIFDNGLGYFEGNVIKYVTHHKDKGGSEDILNGIDYMLLILEKQYGLFYSVSENPKTGEVSEALTKEPEYSDEKYAEVQRTYYSLLATINTLVDRNNIHRELVDELWDDIANYADAEIAYHSQNK